MLSKCYEGDKVAFVHNVDPSIVPEDDLARMVKKVVVGSSCSRGGLAEIYTLNTGLNIVSM